MKNMEYDLYGAKNGIREATTKLAKLIITKKHKYPMMVRRHSDSQVNLMSIPRKDNSTLLDKIIEQGQGYPSTQEGFRYMIRHYLCYVENPIVRYDKAKNKIETYQKRIVTACPEIVALWLNEDVDAIKKKYKLKFDTYETVDKEHKLVAPYLELKIGKDGEHKITKPRKDIDLADDGLTITPLYLINESINTLRDMMKDSCIRFTYTKDNHTERTFTTTINHDFLKETYGDATSWVLDVKAKEYSQKDLLECDTMFRGYVRFAEVGGSRYDGATRSLNFARITKIEPNFEPDLSLIDVDLSIVGSSFTASLTNHPENIQIIKKTFKGYDIEKATSLPIWCEKNEKTYSTEFKRALAKYMLENKDMFDGFTGEPVKTQTTDAGLGIEIDNIDMSDYFDFS